MKILLAALALLFVAFNANATACPVGTSCISYCSDQSTGTSTCNVTLAPNQTLVMVAWTCGAATTGDSQGFLFHAGQHLLQGFSFLCGATDSNFVFTWGATGGFSGTDTCSLVPSTGANSIICAVYNSTGADGGPGTIVGAIGGPATGTHSSGNATTASASDVLVSAGYGEATTVVGSGYTLVTSNTYPPSGPTILLQDKVAGAPGTYNATISDSNSVYWGVDVVGLLPLTVASSATQIGATLTGP